jgi:hypothetical protein
LNDSLNEKPTGTVAGRTSREGRTFASTLAVGFLFVAFVMYRKHVYAVAVAALALSAISVLAGLLVPRRLQPVRRAWMKLGEVIGLVTTPILMTIVYYLILTPVAILKRLMSPRPPVRDSHWHQRPPLPPPARMERQF